MKKCFVVLLFLSFNALAAWDTLTTRVDTIYGSWDGYSSSTVNDVCVLFTNGKIIKLNLNDAFDKTTYVNLLTAKASDFDVIIYLEINGTLSGGCNTGTSIRRHGITKIR